MTSKVHIDEMLQQLGSRDPQEAWSAFLDQYAGLIFQIVRHFEHDRDNASDCFQFICERFCDDRFRRLRRFKPDGPAKFSTWLRTVVRNLYLDWQRKQFGRRRVFRSIARLSELDQEVFRCVHERRQSESEALVSLRQKFPHLTEEVVAESIKRVNQTLTTNQNWLVKARGAISPRLVQQESNNHDLAGAVDSLDNPETLAIAAERTALMHRALRRLSHREKLLIRLRFEEDLTLQQIANLLELENAQRVDRQIKQILASLRDELNTINVRDVSGKNSGSSVKAS